MNRADRIAQLDHWARLAEHDPQAALEDRMARSALSAVAIDNSANQDAILALLPRRTLSTAAFAAFQTVLLDTTLHEDLRRFQIERLLMRQTDPKSGNNRDA